MSREDFLKTYGKPQRTESYTLSREDPLHDYNALVSRGIIPQVYAERGLDLLHKHGEFTITTRMGIVTIRKPD